MQIPPFFPKKRFLTIYQQIKVHPIWDETWYLGRNKDVALTEIDPLFHFLIYGINEGRSLGPYFHHKRWSAFIQKKEVSEAIDQLEQLIVFLTDEINSVPLIDQKRCIRDSGLFDADWYLTKNNDLKIQKVDPLSHYVLYGGIELRWPSKYFNPHQYIAEQGLNDELPFNPLVHYLIYRHTKGNMTFDCDHAASVALEQVRSIVHLDYDLVPVYKKTKENTLSFYRESDRPLFYVWKRLFQALNQSIRHIIMVPWMVRGGADLVAIHALNLAMENKSPQEVLLVMTDSGRQEAVDWLPKNCNLLNLNDFGEALPLEDRVRLALMLCQAVKPYSILNVNSHVGWELFARYGNGLSQFIRLFATLFCAAYDDEGYPLGYAHQYLRSTIDYLAGIYFDNASFIRELVEFYSLPPKYQQKLHLSYQPVRLKQPLKEYRASIESNKIVWASRLCAQKNLEALFKLATQAQQIQFDIYGHGEDQYIHRVQSEVEQRANLFYQGSYSKFEKLPLHQYRAFIYTSHWDGLPNVLLEAAGWGLPIIAPNIGGIPELVTPETGWPVSNPNAIDEYIQALDFIFEHPAEARLRVEKMKQLILDRHSWTHYSQSMRLPDGFGG